MSRIGVNTRLILDDVSVSLGGQKIVSNASLDLAGGQLMALIGPNGAGKTTLIKAIAGLLPSTGRISLNGQDFAAMHGHARARQIGYLPQGHELHWPLMARDVVALGRYPHGLADPAKLNGDHERAVTAAMARTRTLEFADRQANTLSGGERARVMLARVFAVEAPVLLADEPTAALDPRHQIGVMQALKAEAAQGALTIAVTHDIALAARLADAVVLMDKGAIIAHGAPRDVLTPERLAAIYGVSAIHREIEGEALILPWGLA
ncbi:MAG: ABC transporter ATP-binding protein [Bosea sp. (in: a-proteobacteria)]